MAMNCPFCAESVSDNALVCKFCRHDLTYVKQLHAELADKAARIADLEHALAAVPRAATDATSAPAHTTIPVTETILAPPAPASRDVAFGALALLVPLLLLVGVHYLFVFVWDLHVVLLRAATIVIPLAWGFWFPWLGRARLRTLAVLAVALGLAAVTGMLTVSARIDGVPILPTTAHDRWETFQIAVSITLALGCGTLAARTLAALRARADRMRAGYRSALSTVRNSSREPEKMTAQADVLGKLAEFAGPILSGAGAVVASVLSLLK
jgi:hypothetical protein